MEQISKEIFVQALGQSDCSSMGSLLVALHILILPIPILQFCYGGLMADTEWDPIFMRRTLETVLYLTQTCPTTNKNHSSCFYVSLPSQPLIPLKAPLAGMAWLLYTRRKNNIMLLPAWYDTSNHHPIIHGVYNLFSVPDMVVCMCVFSHVRGPYGSLSMVSSSSCLSSLYFWHE